MNLFMSWSSAETLLILSPPWWVSFLELASNDNYLYMFFEGMISRNLIPQSIEWCLLMTDWFLVQLTDSVASLEIITYLIKISIIIVQLMLSLKLILQSLHLIILSILKMMIPINQLIPSRLLPMLRSNVHLSLLPRRNVGPIHNPKSGLLLFQMVSFFILFPPCSRVKLWLPWW